MEPIKFDEEGKLTREYIDFLCATLWSGGWRLDAMVDLVKAVERVHDIGNKNRRTQMSTIDSSNIILEMLENNGVYPGDPQCEVIYQYTNLWGKTTWAVYWSSGYAELFESPAVLNPVLLFNKDIGLTPEGVKYIASFGD